jgi:recombination protein RecR
MNKTTCASLDALINGFKTLPGIGERSALRLALHTLSRNKAGGQMLAEAILHALTHIHSCQWCNNYSDTEICHMCQDTTRDPSICVIENPVDLIAIENSGSYKGHYFVLMGNLSPLNNTGPEELKISNLIDTVKKKQIKEVILATGSTVEGEATAYYISHALKQFSCQCTRLALGIPLGGELEYLDAGTLSHALKARQPIDASHDQDSNY